MKYEEAQSEQPEMMIDARARHRPDPDYLRGLVDQIALSQREIARRLGINESTFRRYLTYPDRRSYSPAPYLVQIALECMAEREIGGIRMADKPEIYGRIDDEGNVVVLYADDGEAVTTLDANVYPVGSSRSVRYEHPDGIVLTQEDAEIIGIPIEA